LRREILCLVWAEVLKGRTNDRNSLWRIREVPWAVISHRGAGELQQVFPRFKFRRGRTVDPSQQGPLDSHVDFYFGVS
jgi:hypothetical protein